MEVERLIVQCHKSLPQLYNHVLECLWVQTDLEDGLEADLRWGGETEHGKVSDEPRCDRVPSSAGRGTSCADSDILDQFPEELLTVVEAAKVLVLSEQLNGWLGAIAVQLGHVQVIHKDHNTLPGRGT